MTGFKESDILTWDYLDPMGYEKYDATSKVLQLKILKMWYPIGVDYRFVKTFTENESRYPFELVGYQEHNNNFMINLTINQLYTTDTRFGILGQKPNGNTLLFPSDMIIMRHPLSVIPRYDFIRNIKIEYILK